MPGPRELHPVDLRVRVEERRRGPSGSAGSVHTRPSASAASTIVRPAGLDRLAQPAPACLRARGRWRRRSGTAGSYEPGWDRVDPLLDLASNRACCAVAVAGALTPEVPLLFGRAAMPEITLDLTLFATAFVTVLVIMDPIGNIPIFLALTKGQDVPTAPPLGPPRLRRRRAS